MLVVINQKKIIKLMMNFNSKEYKIKNILYFTNKILYKIFLNNYYFKNKDFKI